MEGTYGDSRYRHATLDEAREQAMDFVTQCVARDLFPVFVVMGRVGKPQDLLLTLAAKGYEACLPDALFRMTQAYVRAGVAMPVFHPWKSGRKPEGHYLVLTLGHWETRRGEVGAANVRSAFLSGWAGDGGTNYDRYIAWSDHSDLPELIEVVERVGPGEVWTFADRGRLARELVKRGWKARSLDLKNEIAETDYP